MKLGNGESIGVLGGGQLGLMLYQASDEFNIELSFLDPDPNAPCSQTPDFVCGDFKDEKTVVEFGKDKDIVTIEIENVNIAGLRSLQKLGVTVFPDPNLIEIVKDKGKQKKFFQENQIPTSKFNLYSNADEFLQAIGELPVVQKLRTGGYDGRGVQLIRNDRDFVKVFDAPNIMEEFIGISKEFSVIVARNKRGETKSFPSVGMDFNEEANLVEFLYSPSGVKEQVESSANLIAEKLAKAFDLVGIIAVEMFLTEDDRILVNEVAPRPHNSGHHSIEGNVTSQYQQHLRAILDLSLGSTDITKPSVMINLLGAKGYDGPVEYKGISQIEQEDNVFIHLYGKQITRPFRKMGHITVLRDDLEEAVLVAERIKNHVECVSLNEV